MTFINSTCTWIQLKHLYPTIQFFTYYETTEDIFKAMSGALRM